MSIDFAEFKFEPSTNLYINPYSKNEIEYSDGVRVEDEIFDTLVNSEDKSIFSIDLRNSINNWPFEYHLSWERHNLLRHFSFTKSDKILELGCGCGAITRQLGESGASISAIEGSYKRAKSAALRCRDLKNVRVYTSNFNSIRFHHEFDYVLMIGVLEYCPKYINDNNSLDTCINIVRSAMKPDARFILAIENRLGLKYFAGLAEDHVSRPYIGLQDLYEPKSVITLGRVEITNLLKRNGFNSIEFQYPFPDYKLPKVIFTEEALNNPLFNPSEIIRRIQSRDYSNKTRHTFSENLVWPLIGVNNLISDLSNSFLIISEQKRSLRTKTNLLAVYYTTNRKPGFNTKTEFLIDENSKISVKKELLRNEARNADEFLVHNIREEPYYSGKNLDSEIERMISMNDFQGYVKLIKLWIEYVWNFGLKEIPERKNFLSKVKPSFVDCLPFNLILMGDELIYIDKEWEYLKEYTISALLLRYLRLKKHDQIVNKHIQGDEKPPIKLIKYLGIDYSDDIFIESKALDDYLSNAIYNQSPKLRRKNNSTSLKHTILACRIRDVILRIAKRNI